MPRLSKIGAAALAAFGWTGLSTVTASYLVVAGGGGGAPTVGGGGGAGGYQTGTASLNPTLSYTVIVGAGGAGIAAGSTVAGNQGSNSSFNTVTANGGGKGGIQGGATDTSGGSTGGAGGFGTRTGTASQGNLGGTTGWSGAGGGGNSAVGADTPNSNANGGAGGAGTASSITGSSVTYAGGGGGGSYRLTGGAGGSGGGGAGGTFGGTQGVSGTANLGGGGGGGSDTGTGAGSGSGGSGVVIISYPSPQKFGGGIVTTSGSNTIHTFTTSGTLSPLSLLSASALIVAGGGGASGAGGGAGGMQTPTGITIDTNSIYVVTVGAGGTGINGNTVGNNGSNSIFSAYATASVGGGGGGCYNGVNGVNGGSGGGGGGSSGATSNGGTATAGQGNNGGTGFGTGGRNPSGGGGGAGAVGGNATSASTSTGGAGGAGLSSSISGTATYYAGGGGGSGDVSSTGGIGGGGAATTTGAGIAGTPNTGGGGGGVFNAYTPGQGGSGVVIISYAGSTQQMAGGTVTISGGNVIHTFTSSGYLTPLKFVGNSLRFRSSASAYLNRTFSTPTAATTWSFSCWIKRGTLGSAQSLMDANTSGIYFDGGDHIALKNNGANVATSTAVYRDPAAWYHVFVKNNGVQSEVYINGSTTTSAYWLGTLANFNTAIAHSIGRSTDSTRYLDGEMTEVNFIDGQALTPSSFGTFNSYGVWQPITYGGSYGTNGFYLPFTNKTSTTTLGYDFSPNGNNWTPNNISLTTGSTYDSMTDVPTLTSATAANTCTWNPLLFYSTTAPTLSNGNLTAAWDNTSMFCGSTMACISNGKTYAEFTLTTANTTRIGIKLASDQSQYNGGWTYVANLGTIRDTTDTTVQTVASSTNGDVIALAVDLNANTLQFYKNGSTLGTAVTIANASNWMFWVGQNGSGSAIQVDANFGQQPFTYTPPTGFLPLNTYNL